MSVTVTIVCPDADTASQGNLYLPGEPLPSATPCICAMCDEPGEWNDSHSHLGVVVVLTDYGMGTRPTYMPEAIHLRCVADTAEQFGTVGMILGNIESCVQDGRHAASV